MKKLFHKYGSLVNHYVEKFISSMMMNGVDGGDWVATEKIHGANFSFWTDGDTVWIGKRSGVIGDGHNFFSSFKLEKYFPDIKVIYGNLVDAGIAENGDVMVIYGEIFGGSFFGQQEPGSKSVQGGMNYHPGTEFAAYDIMVYPLDGEDYCLSYLEMLEMIGHGVPLCPEVARGDFYTLLKLDNNFQSLVPAMFNLEIPEGEWAQSEGFVIRPLDGEKYIKGGRCIIKSKNEKFNERGGKTKTAGDKTAASKLTAEEEQLYMRFSIYFNQARFESVVSKFGDVTWKDFGKLNGLLIVDAKEEFERDTGILLKDGDFWGKAKKHINGLAGEIVREHLKKNA